MTYKIKTIKVFFVLLIITTNKVYGINLDSILVEDKLENISTTRVDEETQINNQTLSQKLFNSVMINETTGHTNSNVISIRGNSFRATDYYEDGVPLYKSTNGFVDLSMYRANNTNIQINAGGSQGLYSSSASGGEILLSSKKLKDGFNASIDTTLSTNDMYMNILLSNKTDSWYWKLDLNGMKQNYYKLSNDFLDTSIQATDKRVNSDKEQIDGSLKLGYKIDEFSDVAFKISHLKSEYGNPVQVYDEPSNPFSTNADYTRVDDKQLTSYWFYYDYKNSDLKFSVRSYYDVYKDIYNFYDSLSFTTLKYLPSTYNDSRLGSIASLKYRYNQKHKGSLSIRVDKDIHEQVIVNDPTKKHYEAIENSFSYVHSFQVSDDFLTSASIQYKKQNLTKAYQFTAQDIKYKNNSAVDFQVTTDYKVSSNQAYYMSLAKKNRFASLTELYPFFPWDTPNTNVEPEESDSIEIGSSIKFIKDTVVNISLFYNNIENMIVYEDNGFINLEKAVLRGFEAKIYNFTFNNQDIELSYAYTDATDKDDNKIVQIPKSKLLLQDIIELNSKANINISYLYVSSRDDIYNSKRYSLSSYSLIDMQLSYQPTNNLLFRTGVKNIFDKNWEYKYGQPAQGRSFFISLNYKY